MRYLKTYKLFESNWYDIKDHIKVLSDISLSLWDKDFNVQVSNQTISKSDFNDPTPEHECIVVNIMKRGDKKFTYSQVKDDLVDMIDYMDREGWKILEVEYLDPAFGRHLLQHYGELTPDNLFSSRIDSLLNQIIIKFVEKKEVKTNESTEEDIHREFMIKKYGVEVIEECDEVIKNISDMLLELGDLDLTTTIGYAPMTILSMDPNPKISVDIIGQKEIFDSNSELIHEIGEQIQDYAKDYKFVVGSGEWDVASDRKKYAILLQK